MHKISYFTTTRMCRLVSQDFALEGAIPHPSELCTYIKLYTGFLLASTINSHLNAQGV